MAALSFWMTARSSAIVLAARTLRINCLTKSLRVSYTDLINTLGANTYVSSWRLRVDGPTRESAELKVGVGGDGEAVQHPALGHTVRRFVQRVSLSE